MFKVCQFIKIGLKIQLTTDHTVQTNLKGDFFSLTSSDKVIENSTHHTKLKKSQTRQILVFYLWHPLMSDIVF